MVVFEALACSLPVIITKNVGDGDFIKNGEEGFIVDIRNTQQIKDKIEYLNQNRQVLKTMSAKAKKTFDAYQKRNDNYARRVINSIVNVKNIKMTLDRNDKTPYDFSITKNSKIENLKKILRRFLYPLLLKIRRVFLNKKFGYLKEIGLEEILGYRGTDYEALRKKLIVSKISKTLLY